MRLLLLLGALLLGGAAAWRQASRARRLPCPAWMGRILENPYSDRLAGASLLLARAGVVHGMRVLDAGCGTGRVSIAAAERVGASGEVVALDVQPAMLERVRCRAMARGATNVRTLAASVEAAAALCGEGVFDRVLLVTVLGEIPDREGALRALHAVLRPGGLLSVTEFLPDPHFQPRGAVRRMAEAAGFQAGESYGGALAFTSNFHKPAE